MARLLSNKQKVNLQVQAFRLLCLLIQLYIIHSILNNTLYNDSNSSTIRHILLGKNMYEHITGYIHNNPITNLIHKVDPAQYTHTHDISSVRFCISLVHLVASLIIPHLMQRNARPYYNFNKKWLILAICAKPLYTALEYTVPSITVLKVILPHQLVHFITIFQTIYLTLGGQLLSMLALLWYFNKQSVNKYAPYVHLTLGQQIISAGYSLYYSLSIYVPNLLINNVHDRVINLLISKHDTMTNLLIITIGISIAVIQHSVFIVPVNNILRKYRKQIDYSDQIVASIIKQDDSTVIMQIPITLFDTDLSRYKDKQNVVIARETAEKLFEQIKPPIKPTMIDNIKNRLRSRTRERAVIVNDGRHNTAVTVS